MPSSFDCVVLLLFLILLLPLFHCSTLPSAVRNDCSAAEAFFGPCLPGTPRACPGTCPPGCRCTVDSCCYPRTNPSPNPAPAPQPQTNAGDGINLVNLALLMLLFRQRTFGTFGGYGTSASGCQDAAWNCFRPDVHVLLADAFLLSAHLRRLFPRRRSFQQSVPNFSGQCVGQQRNWTALNDGILKKMTQFEEKSKRERNFITLPLPLCSIHLTKLNNQQMQTKKGSVGREGGGGPPPLPLPQILACLFLSPRNSVKAFLRFPPPIPSIFTDAMSSSPFTSAPVPPNKLPLLPLLRLLLLLLLPLSPTVRCSSGVCPAGQFRFGPCIGGQCPPTCPGVCTCMGGQDCCTNQNIGGISGPTSTSGASLTRLLLAFLLGNGRPGLPALQLALCRDNALNCPLYLTYCQLPLYALCIPPPYFRRIHCTATCGGCGDDTLGLLLARLLFGALTGSTTTAPPLASAQVAIRDKMPPIRAIQKEPKSTNKSSSKCPEEKRNGTAKGESVMNSAKKAIPRPNGNRTESPSQKTAPTTARPMLQFAIPPGLAIPRQQQQLLQAMAGRAREGSIFVREREKVAAMLMRRFMGG